MTASLADHPHHHDHARDHAHSEVPSDPALRTKALESLLTEKGLVDPAAIDAWVEAYETKIGPRRGAQIVARAWIDPQFKARLLQDATPRNRAIRIPRAGSAAYRGRREHACRP